MNNKLIISSLSLSLFLGLSFDNETQAQGLFGKLKEKVGPSVCTFK
jgi:hypothetical protein